MTGERNRERTRAARLVAVVGPGALGGALARRIRDARGFALLGLLGRDADRLVDAIRFVGAGRPLRAAQLRDADVVLLTVPDHAIEACAEAFAGVGAVAPGSVWAHCSGATGLEVLAPLAARGAETGVLHPACPVPDRSRGVASLPGSPALVRATSAAAHAVLTAFATALGLRPITPAESLAAAAGGAAFDPVAYHAGCALAANGLTGLLASATEVLVGSGLDPEGARAVAAALAARAVEDVAARGPAAALSGPLVRGDVATVAAHLAAVPEDLRPLYRAAMRRALQLLDEAGRAPEHRAELLRLLDDVVPLPPEA
jgi:predicted short-subunit dehydrogenase-like oxidoreductase (DUF2520 family)